jgi:hypothetical protein
VTYDIWSHCIVHPKNIAIILWNLHVVCKFEWMFGLGYMLVWYTICRILEGLGWHVTKKIQNSTDRVQ